MRQPRPKVRIVKADDLNFEVQEYREVTSTRDTKHTRKGDTRFEWVGGRYFGHRLDFAAQFALAAGMQEGGTVTPVMVRNAVDEIVEETKRCFQGRPSRK